MRILDKRNHKIRESVLTTQLKALDKDPTFDISLIT